MKRSSKETQKLSTQGNRIETMPMACSVCGGGLGRSLWKCERREIGECPFQTKRDMGSVSIYVVAFLVFSGVCFYWVREAIRHLERDGVENIFLALFCFGIGFPLLVSALLMLVGIRRLIVDVEGGLIWQQARLFEIPLVTRRVKRKERIALNSPSEMSLFHPPSCSALLLCDVVKTRESIAAAISRSIVVLAAAGYVDLFRITIVSHDFVFFGPTSKFIHIEAKNVQTSRIPLGIIEEKLLAFLPYQRTLAEERLFRFEYSWIHQFLEYIDKKERVAISEIAEMMAAACEERGLMKPIGDEGDFRRRKLRFTEQGRHELLKDLQVVHRIYRGFDGETAAAIADLKAEIEAAIKLRKIGVGKLYL